MEVILELSGHPKANVKKVVITDKVTVGRSQKCGLQIASAAVSRRHCEIRVTADRVSVVDLGSSNGTFIDAKRLPPGEETPLPSGSRLNVGGVRFLVQYAASRQAATEKALPPLVAVSDGAGDDVMLVEPDEMAELANESNLLTGDDLPSVAASADEEAPLSLDEESVEPAFAPLEPVAESEDEPIIADESFIADEPIVADEPALVDEADFSADLTENPVAAGDVADAEVKSQAADELPLAVDALFDEEPDLEAMFSDAPSSPAAGSIESPEAEEAVEDIPILEEDEDAAFSFLTDEDESAEKNSPSDTEDSRLGDFLSQLGRD